MPPMKQRYRHQVRRSKNMPQATTPMVTTNSRYAVLLGESTNRKIESNQVINRKADKTNHTPQRLRRGGTTLCRPASRCTKSLRPDIGHTAHQNRPSSRNVTGSAGHQMIQTRAEPGVSWAL